MISVFKLRNLSFTLVYTLHFIIAKNRLDLECGEWGRMGPWGRGNEVSFTLWTSRGLRGPKLILQPTLFNLIDFIPTSLCLIYFNWIFMSISLASVKTHSLILNQFPWCWKIYFLFLGKKYCYGSTQGEYCHCDYCKCKHGYGSTGYGHCH